MPRWKILCIIIAAIWVTYKLCELYRNRRRLVVKVRDGIMRNTLPAVITQKVGGPLYEGFIVRYSRGICEEDFVDCGWSWRRIHRDNVVPWRVKEWMDVHDLDVATCWNPQPKGK